MLSASLSTRVDVWCRLSRLDLFRGHQVNYIDNIRVLIWYEIFGAIGYAAVPRSHAIQILEKRAGRIDRGASISAPPFSPCTQRVTVAGFDKIARAHASATRKWVLKRRRGRGVCPVRISSPSSSSASPPHLAPPLSTPPLHRHGEGENGGAGTREEGDGGGEGQEAESRVVVALGAAARLDPGRLDPVFAPAGRSG